MRDPHRNPAKISFGNGHSPLLRGFTFALVFLGVCVFAWGLRYKLSLYQPPHSFGQRMPAAKLLITKERMTAPAADLRQTASRGSLPGIISVWALALLAMAGLGLLTGGRAWSEIPSRSRILPALARGAPSAVRPPPILL